MGHRVSTDFRTIEHAQRGDLLRRERPHTRAGFPRNVGPLRKRLERALSLLVIEPGEDTPAAEIGTLPVRSRCLIRSPGDIVEILGLPLILAEVELQP